MRPEDLAAELGISGKTVRAWLRDKYPRSAGEKHQRWQLTPAQERAVRERFAERRQRAASREQMIVTTIALPERMHARLLRAAAELSTVMTELVRQAVSDWLERRSSGRAGR